MWYIFGLLAWAAAMIIAAIVLPAIFVFVCLLLVKNKYPLVAVRPIAHAVFYSISWSIVMTCSLLFLSGMIRLSHRAFDGVFMSYILRDSVIFFIQTFVTVLGINRLIRVPLALRSVLAFLLFAFMLCTHAFLYVLIFGEATMLPDAVAKSSASFASAMLTPIEIGIAIFNVTWSQIFTSAVYWLKESFSNSSGNMFYVANSVLPKAFAVLLAFWIPVRWLWEKFRGNGVNPELLDQRPEVAMGTLREIGTRLMIGVVWFWIVFLGAFINEGFGAGNDRAWQLAGFSDLVKAIWSLAMLAGLLIGPIMFGFFVRDLFLASGGKRIDL